MLNAIWQKLQAAGYRAVVGLICIVLSAKMLFRLAQVKALGDLPIKDVSGLKLRYTVITTYRSMARTSSPGMESRMDMMMNETTNAHVAPMRASEI